MKFMTRKFYLLILASTVILVSSFSSFAQLPVSTTAAKDVSATKDFINQQDVIDEIYRRTGVQVIPSPGSTVFVDPQKVAESNTEKAISKPTKEASSYPATGNWSGTKNYTYTKYYFRAGSFYARSDYQFNSDYYTKDGTYIGSSGSSTQLHGFHEDGWVLSESYYVKITNGSNSPATNASWEAN